jgi:hypothetical protein
MICMQAVLRTIFLWNRQVTALHLKPEIFFFNLDMFSVTILYRYFKPMWIVFMNPKSWSLRSYATVIYFRLFVIKPIELTFITKSFVAFINPFPGFMKTSIKSKWISIQSSVLRRAPSVRIFDVLWSGGLTSYSNA